MYEVRTDKRPLHRKELFMGIATGEILPWAQKSVQKTFRSGQAIMLDDLTTTLAHDPACTIFAGRSATSARVCAESVADMLCLAGVLAPLGRDAYLMQ